jgi:Pin2-interacting protein X1
MGWKEGEGLGASKQGIKSHIRVKKKFENWGVGAVEAAQHAQSWTNGMLDFHRVLSNLSEVVSEHARRAAASDASSSDDDSDALRGEEQQRAGQARGKKSAGRKGAEQKAGKERKKRKAAPASGGSDSDDEAEAEAAPKRVRAATHIGRFKKREAAKMVKAYSQTDLAAIIGVDPFAAAAAQLAEVRADRRDDGGSGYDSDTEPSASGSDGEDRAEGAQEQQQQQQQAVQEQAAGGEAAPPQREMIVVRRPMAGTRPAAPAPQPQEARRPGWWQVCFHRAAGPGGAGAGAGVGSGPAAITIHGFSEQDQTNLYNLAHVGGGHA